ncbi:MAG: hypothetical protein L0216_11560 [Planctomycetales bacterium]|nr:hypothetical protein [Planctomycetales bacterium]
MITPSMFLLGVLLPALVAGLAIVLAVVPARPASERGERRRAWAVPLGLGAATLVGHWGVTGLPSVPPAESTQWLFVIAAAATALGLAEALRPVSFGWTWALRSVVVVSALALLLRPILRSTWGPIEGPLMVAALAIGASASWAILDRLADRARGPGFPLALSVLAGGGAVAVGLSGSQLVAQLAGALAAALGAAASVAWLSPGLAWSRSAAAVPALVLPALWVEGRFYSELPWSSLALLALAPGFALAGAVGPLGRLGPRAGALAQAGLTSLPVAAAVALALPASSPFGL